MRDAKPDDCCQMKKNIGIFRPLIIENSHCRISKHADVSYYLRNPRSQINNKSGYCIRHYPYLCVTFCKAEYTQASRVYTWPAHKKKLLTRTLQGAEQLDKQGILSTPLHCTKKCMSWGIVLSLWNCISPNCTWFRGTVPDSEQISFVPLSGLYSCI